MEIIIQQYWSKETRNEQINKFINILAIDLYEKCKTSNSIPIELLENINLELCTIYIRKIVEKYTKKIDFGSLQIDLYEQDVLKVIELANEQITKLA